jgi:TnpA family transposase
MLRAIVALSRRRIAASVLIKRISGSRLGDAFVALGQLVRTRYLLRYFHDAELRREVRRTLSLMESRHKVSRDLFMGSHGRFAGHSLRSVSTRASALLLLSNCVVGWNAMTLQRIVGDVRRAGHEVTDDVLAGLSPLGLAHVQTRGIYRFDIEG